jgi:threonine/homoserine/homoserine lactone efflux protein
MADLPSFVLAAIALTGSPGPATLGLAAAGAAYGTRRSLALLVGILVGVVAVMMVTAGGLTGVVLARPRLAGAVSLLAAAYMLYLAWRIATAPPLGEADATGRPPGFGAGVLLGVGNPKAYAAMAALFSGFVLVRDRPLADTAAKTLLLIAIMIAVDWLWLRLGAALMRACRRPVLGRAVNLGFAVLLVASVGLAFVL